MRPLSFESFRDQEQALILLNLIALSGLFLIHVWHFSVDGGPEQALLVCFGLRFLWQTGDFLWLQSRGEPLSQRSVAILARMSIVIHLAFAWMVTLFGDEERSHYIVLMALPVAAAGFRFNWKGLFAVWLVAAAHTFFEVYFYHLGRPPLIAVEFFEAASIALLYFVVGVATYLLARQLYDREARLEQSLIELEETRNAMIRQERQAAIGRLSRAIAHEIRNPVTMILSSVNHWKTHRNCREARELMDMIHDESKRLENLTTDFLEFARERRLEIRDSEIQDALELAISMAKAQAEAADVDIRMENTNGLKAAYDPFAVQQILLNLIRNAIEASGRGGNVILSSREDGDAFVVLSVENDAGPISAETVELLFQPFETTKPRGSGLGLATSLTIAEAHGGSLELAANEPGRVRFDLILPVISKTEEKV